MARRALVGSTKTGNREIRKPLVLGATSMVGRADGWNSATGAWLRRTILERRPVRLVTVALATRWRAHRLGSGDDAQGGLPSEGEVPRSQRQRLLSMLSAGWQAAGASSPDLAGSAEQRDGKGCGQFNSSGNTVQSLVAPSTPNRLVPDTPAHTHDGQRRTSRYRSDIRAQLTGSFHLRRAAVHEGTPLNSSRVTG